MSMDRKRAIVAEARAALAAAELVAVVEHFGVSGPSMTSLRREARSRGWSLRVVKNTLARRALSGTAQAGLSQWLGGPVLLLLAPREGRAALRWVCEALPRQSQAEPSAEWSRMRSSPVAYRQQWRAQQGRRSGGWSRLPRPGAVLLPRGAWLEGDLLDAEEALAEAKLTPEVVYGQLLATLQGPGRRLLGTLSAKPTELARLLDALRDAQEEAAMPT